MNSFYSDNELREIGFQSVGTNVLISRKTSIYGAEHMTIGNDVRIDDFCILSGNLTIHNYVHIAAYCCLFGGKSGIEFCDFTGLSSRSAVYAESDDYSGMAFSNPTLPMEYREVTGGKVVFEKHALVGTGSTILPGVILHEGVSVGSMSLVTKSLDEWGIYIGIPCKRIKERQRKLLELEVNFLKEVSNDSKK